MTEIVLGLSHRTAQVVQREKASLTRPAARTLLRAVRDHPAIAEAAVLSTCNRTELIAEARDPRRAEATLARALVRAETRLAVGAVSVSSVAVELARGMLGDLRDRRALLVGAGGAAEATARALRGHGLRDVVVANRSAVTAGRLAERFGGRATGLDTLEQELRGADVVVSSTDAPGTIIDASQIGRGPLVLIDIAVPRDIDARAGELPGVCLRNIDDLERLVRANLDGRRAEAARAEAILEGELRRMRPLAMALVT